jgi:dehydrogenase/reductase SDR family member 4
MLNNIFSLEGKIALITGASKGIGEAIARYYVAAGAKVVINARKADELALVAADISAQTGGVCVPFAANAGDLEGCQKMVAFCVAEFGGVDILVNNAATNPVFGSANDCPSWAFEKIMAVNVQAPFELGKLVYPLMAARGGGSVVNISSIAGITPDAGLGIYSVSKAALNMLTKVCANEWGAEGVRVNAICPGLIKTKFSEALWKDDKMLQHFTKNIPIARMGTVDEIAGLALYLAADASSYCTGSIFTVDGGTTI